MNPDEAILALLDASPVLFLFDTAEGGVGEAGSVYDGSVEVDKAAKVISVPLPYIAYFSSLGYDHDERLGGRVGGRVKQFQLTGVGQTREQAGWVLERGREALSRKRPMVNSQPAGLILLRDSMQVRRDDEYTRPGGKPLFYGVEQYEVAI